MFSRNNIYKWMNTRLDVMKHKTKWYNITLYIFSPQFHYYVATSNLPEAVGWTSSSHQIINFLSSIIKCIVTKKAPSSRRQVSHVNHAKCYIWHSGPERCVHMLHLNMRKCVVKDYALSRLDTSCQPLGVGSVRQEFLY